MKKTDLNKKRNYTENRIDRRFIEDMINDLPCGHDYDQWDEINPYWDGDESCDM
jgi:pyocin large subunit-like protein